MIEKSKKFLKEKNLKIAKWKHAFEGSASTYNWNWKFIIVEIVNFFNPELQLQDTESAIKSKLIELLTQLKRFKFVTTLILVFKKIESERKKRQMLFKLKSRSNY